MDKKYKKSPKEYIIKALVDPGIQIVKGRGFTAPLSRRETYKIRNVFSVWSIRDKYKRKLGAFLAQYGDIVDINPNERMEIQTDDEQKGIQ